MPFLTFTMHTVFQHRQCLSYGQYHSRRVAHTVMEALNVEEEGIAGTLAKRKLKKRSKTFAALSNKNRSSTSSASCSCLSAFRCRWNIMCVISFPRRVTTFAPIPSNFWDSTCIARLRQPFSIQDGMCAISEVLQYRSKESWRGFFQ